MYEDKELKEYRDLLPPPTQFEEGFGWKSMVGALFIGFLMMPGSMYLGLVIGHGIGPAARWVTIILFAEMAKRSYTHLRLTQWLAKNNKQDGNLYKANQKLMPINSRHTNKPLNRSTQGDLVYDQLHRTRLQQ